MSFQRTDGLAPVSWGEGPLALWRAGIQVMSVWQRVWLDNVSRSQGLFKVWPTASEKALAPWADLARSLGRLGATPLAAPRPASAARKPAAAAKPASGEVSLERQDIEAAIAVKQGRTSPRLGCLEGVEVVGGSVPSTVVVVEPPVVLAAAPVAVEPQVAPAVAAVAVEPQVAPAVAAVAVEPQVAPAAAAAVAEPQVLTAATAVVVESPVAPAVAAVALPESSVTSMLAMQAKSLAKAVRPARTNASAAKVAVKATDAKAKSGVKVAKTAVAVAETPVKTGAKKLAKPSAKARQAG